MSEAEAFERAILENPDDSTAYAAYADWLQEHDDPRGEFMQVQLALEDESRPAAERKALAAREAELLKEHEREWPGELADPLAARDEEHEIDRLLAEHRWRRGVFAELTTHQLTRALTYALADAPAARFLRVFRVYDTEISYYGNGEGNPPFRKPTPASVRWHWELLELIGTPCLQHLRVFQMGDAEPAEDSWCDCHTQAVGLEHVIASMPCIEELHLLCKDYEPDPLFALPNLAQLRVLRMYHLGGRGRGDRRYEYPLDILAANPALTNLTHLQFHPHWAEEGYEDSSRSYLPLNQVHHLLRSPHLKSLTHLQLRLSDMGDEGVREIVASGILKRLKWLDLRHGAITDAGAKLFADCPDTRNLESLDLSRNAVGPAGLSLLRKAKVNAVANRPLTDQELESREYLREGDFE